MPFQWNWLVWTPG